MDRSETSRCRMNHPARPGRLPRLLKAAIATGLAASCLLASGCGPRGLTDVKSSAALERIVAESMQPVMVEFYKEGCEHCSALEIGLTHIVGEHSGQIKAVKFLLMKADGNATVPELATKHNVLVYPTVIFFAKGQEKKRYEQHYVYADYETTIQELVKPSTGR